MLVSNLNKNKFLMIFLSLVFSGILFLVAVQGVFAATYNSTYNMLGGVYSRTFSVGSSHKFTVNLNPTYSVDHSAHITLYLQRVAWYGVAWESSGKSVSSWYNSTTKFTGNSSGDYRIYIRDYPGIRMKGNVGISY